MYINHLEVPLAIATYTFTSYNFPKMQGRFYFIPLIIGAQHKHEVESSALRGNIEETI